MMMKIFTTMAAFSVVQALRVTVKPSSSEEIVEARFNFKARQDDELSFKEGEKIVVTEKGADDWWEGYMVSDPDREGLFPSNYVWPYEPEEIAPEAIKKSKAPLFQRGRGVQKI